MEWNLRPSSLWEWENLFECEAKSGENPKKLQQIQEQQRTADFSAEVERGISSGDGGSAGSDFGHASSKSSVSASLTSSASNKFTLDGFEPAYKVKHHGNSPTPEISAGSGEPFLSLKLGKRMYFKDICSESNNNNNEIVSAAVGKSRPSPNSAVSMSSSATTPKRTKSAGPSALSPRCQVEGCNLDLSSAKDYHRKHRICENHSKSPRVIVGGVERRFCQQCSRFHGLSEFDEKKRSCRRRLSDHNARRRKPQPEPVRLNPARFSSIYDEPTQKMSLVFDQSPRLFATSFAWDHHHHNHHGTTDSISKPTKEYTSFAWDHNHHSKPGHTKEYLSRPLAKTTASQGQNLLPNNEMPGNILYPHNNSTRLAPNKSPEFLHSGLEESVEVCSEVNTSQDLHHALSLLSTSSWGSRGTKHVLSHDASSSSALNIANNNNVPLNPINQGLVVPSELWQQTSIETEPTLTPPRQNPNNNTTQFQDLHLFKPPTSDSGFYSYHF